jgi:alpha-tubulin suppressor-like RCC1 family protein
MTIPAGALSSTITFTITPIVAPILGSVGQAYDIEPSGTQFAIPVTLTFPYTTAELGGGAPSNFAISTVVSSAWQPISAPVVDAAAGTLSGETMDLCDFATAPYDGVWDFYSYHFVPDTTTAATFPGVYGEIILYGLATANLDACPSSAAGIAGLSIGQTEYGACDESIQYQFTGADLDPANPDIAWDGCNITGMSLSFSNGTLTIQQATIPELPGCVTPPCLYTNEPVTNEFWFNGDLICGGSQCQSTLPAGGLPTGYWEFKEHWRQAWAGPVVPPANPPIALPTPQRCDPPINGEFSDPAEASVSTCCLSANIQTDPNNCGGCGTVCPNGSCISGLCIGSATAISAGYYSMCALLSNATVDCWGYNESGELGDGTSTGPDVCNGYPCADVPVEVPGLSGVTAISLGGNGAACALLSGGTVECWGDNTYGELGIGNETGPDTCNGYPCSTTPVAVTGLTGTTAISMGEVSACALLSDSTVACWGENTFGQLGNGTTTSSFTPVAVTGLTGATAISVAADAACALISGGTVECWGNGNGATTGTVTTPVTVPNLEGVLAIVPSNGSTCVLLAGGTVDCWGGSQVGALGSAAGITFSPTNSQAQPGLTGVTAIASSESNTCALIAGGTVECWGDNSFGELGDGTLTGSTGCSGVEGACSTTPVEVSGLTNVTALAVGQYTTCALISGGSIQCWGTNKLGNLGNGSPTGPQTCAVQASCSMTPVAVLGF